jgi:hypothetical protein
MLFRATIVGLCCAALAPPAAVRADDKKPEPCVVFDFTNWSVHSDTSHVTLKVDFDGVASEPYCLGGEGVGIDAADFAQIYSLSFTDKVKVEWIDKVKVRVYGFTDENGNFRPAVRGEVVSKKLKPEQLPTVTNPGKKG